MRILLDYNLVIRMHLKMKEQWRVHFKMKLCGESLSNIQMSMNFLIDQNFIFVSFILYARVKYLLHFNTPFRYIYHDLKCHLFLN